MDQLLSIGGPIAAVWGLTQIFKWIAGENKFLPLIALVFGLAVAALTYTCFDCLTPFEVSREIILNGIVYGFSAIGLFSGVKNVKEGVTEIVKG